MSSITSCSTTPTANSGINPTIERRRSGILLSGGHREHIVKEIVLVIPEPDSLLPMSVIAPSDLQEMVEKLDGHVLVGRIAPAELERHAQHVEAEHRHPRRAVGLLDVAAGGQRP